MLKKLINIVPRLLPSSLLNRMTIALQPCFTVTVAAVVLDEERRVLLLKHNFRGGSGWGIPGGFLSADEQPEEGLRREMREEVGLEISVVELALVRAVNNARQVQIVYRCLADGEPKARSIEVERCEWFAPDGLPDQLSRSQRAIISEALNDRLI